MKMSEVKIEVLFPEFCTLFGDSSNVRYLRCCLPEADFIETGYMDEPYFVKHEPSLIYMGATTESAQEKIIRRLMPYKERIKELIQMGTPILFTSNAMEVLGQHIIKDNGSRLEALGIYPFYAKQDMAHRFNGLLRGHFGQIEMLGFKTQFTMAYGETDAFPFIQSDKGVGMNRETANEGIHDHNLFATYLVGPLLVVNPDFTEYLMKDVMGIEDAELAFGDLARAAYERRKKEFYDPKTEY